MRVGKGSKKSTRFVAALEELLSPGGIMIRNWVLTVIMLITAAASAEYRTWTDRNGNTIEAELVRKFGEDIILRDKKGKTHKIDPEKLCDEDQLYVNPPPPPPKEFSLTLLKKSRQKVNERDSWTKQKITAFEFEFTLKVTALLDRNPPDALHGVLFVIGEDRSGMYVVLAKVEAPIEFSDDGEGMVSSEKVDLVYDTNDRDRQSEVKYEGYLVMLLSSDGSVLEKKFSNSFLDAHRKALALNVGDRFNDRLEKITKTE